MSRVAKDKNKADRPIQNGVWANVLSAVILGFGSLCWAWLTKYQAVAVGFWGWLAEPAQLPRWLYFLVQGFAFIGVIWLVAPSLRRGGGWIKNASLSKLKQALADHPGLDPELPAMPDEQLKVLRYVAATDMTGNGVARESLAAYFSWSDRGLATVLRVLLDEGFLTYRLEVKHGDQKVLYSVTEPGKHYLRAVKGIE